MSLSMIDRCRPTAGQAPQLMLDAWHYAARLLDRGTPPWTDSTAMVSLGRRLAGLLRPEVLSLPLLAWFEARVAADARLLALMRQRSRTAYAMKTALADEALRRDLADLVGALCGAMPAVALVPTLAAPARWLQAAYTAAHGHAADDIDDDVCEQAEVFLADLLRVLAPLPIAGLLLNEPLARADEAWAAVHTPVFNAAVHYRWPLGAAVEAIDGTLPAPLSWRVGAPAAAGTPAALTLPPTFWQADGVLPAAAGLYAGHLPEDAQPETVLAQLTRLRSVAA